MVVNLAVKSDAPLDTSDKLEVVAALNTAVGDTTFTIGGENAPLIGEPVLVVTNKDGEQDSSEFLPLLCLPQQLSVTLQLVWLYNISVQFYLLVYSIHSDAQCLKWP